MAALPLLATSSPQYQEAVATVIQRANLAYGDFIKSQEGVTFNGQVSCGVGEGETETPAGWTGLVLRPRALPSQHPSRRGRCSGPWTSPHQVCLIGDCVGGILAFDALCCSNQPVSESQSSSRRGSVASVQVRAPSSPQSRGPSGWRLCHPLAPNIPEACGKKEGLGLPTQVPRGGGQMHGTGEQLQRGQTGAQAASAGSEAGSAPWRADPSPWRSGSSEPPGRREDPRSLPRSLHRRVASSLVGWARWQDQWEVSKAQMGRLGQE